MLNLEHFLSIGCFHPIGKTLSFTADPMESTASLFVVGSFVAASAAAVGRFPKPGESLAAHAFFLEAGGKGFNVAVAARRLGASVDGILPIGTDMLAGLAAPAVERARLPLTILQSFDGATGAGIGFIDGSGENCLAVYPGANALLSSREIEFRRGAIAAAAVTMAQFEIGDEPIKAAFSIARAAGRLTLLNPSPFRLPDREMLALTSVLVINAVEAGAFATSLALAVNADDRIALASTLMTQGPEVVVITLGGQGALLCRRGHGATHHGAFEVEAIDTLGAGDAFAAAVAVGLSEQLDWGDIIRRACACGAMVAARRGVFDAFPEADALEAFLACGNQPVILD